MTSSRLSRLDNDDCTLVLDASVVINLLGTGNASLLIRALRRKCVVEQITWREVTRDPFTGKTATEPLKALVSAGLLEREKMGTDATSLFLDLTLAQAPDGLGDGEAATLAHAANSGATAVIDEKKAIRISAAKLPDLRTLSTLDLLSCSLVSDAVDRMTLADAVCSALMCARMRVPGEFHKWVLELIGKDRASKCSSLSRSP
jgi:predicted nucleic acid-binding protein